MSALKLLENRSWMDGSCAEDISEVDELLNINVLDEFKSYIQKSKRSVDNIINQFTLATEYRRQDYLAFLNGKSKVRNEIFERETYEIIKILNHLMDLNQNELVYSDQTTAAKLITRGLKLSRINKMGVMIIGYPGLGKSSTAKFEADNNEDMYISIDTTVKRITPLLKKLYRTFKGNYYAISNSAMLNEIAHYLKLYNKIIVCDQADYLTAEGIDILRTLAENANVGLCLLGLPNLHNKLNKDNPEVKQLLDKIRLSVELEPPTFNDLVLVLNKNWPGLSDEIKKEFFKYSRKTYRLLSHLIFHCRQELFNEENLGIELTVDHIRMAAGLLPKSKGQDEK
ncbi:MAG TPA: hypothetical protein DHV28_13665 [Ignavibacteriales bacterium]|nr:hypothetical protein [Ignavibacteriales bacterium]